MKEHQSNIVKFEENLKKEQDRTKEMLRQKLDERHKKKKSMELDKIRTGYQESFKTAISKERRILPDLGTEGTKVLTSMTRGLAPKFSHEKESTEG